MNTIHPNNQPDYPGDIEIENKIRNSTEDQDDWGNLNN